jgi:hypothetical protein
MKALILSAGLGTRLRPLTDDTPKPLIEVGGKPVIQHLIEKLWKSGVYQIIVNMHHLPMKMVDVEGVLLFYEKELLGEEGTMIALRDWLEGTKDDPPFLVLNGDTLSDVDISEMKRLYWREKKPIRYINDGVFGGVAVYPPNWFKHMSQAPYLYNPGIPFIDIGTPEGLAKARAKYEPTVTTFEYRESFFYETI